MHWLLYTLILLGMVASYLSDICTWQVVACVGACVVMGMVFDARRKHWPWVQRVLGVALFVALLYFDMMQSEGIQGHFLHFCLDMIWALLGYRGMSHEKTSERVQVGVLSLIPLVCMAYALPATEFLGVLVVYFFVLFGSLARQALQAPTTGSVAGQMRHTEAATAAGDHFWRRAAWLLWIPILIGTAMFFVVPRAGADANVMGLGPQIGAFPDVALNKTGKINLDPSLVFRAELPEREGGYYWRVEVQNVFDGVSWRSYYSPSPQMQWQPEPEHAIEFVREWRDYRVPSIEGTVLMQDAGGAQAIRFYPDNAGAWHRFGWRRGNPLTEIRFRVSDLSRYGELAMRFWKSRFHAAPPPGQHHLIWPSRRDGKVHQRLTDFAKEIAGDARTDREKVQRIQRFLKSNYRYTLERPPREGNVVEDFLFRQKQGHCEVFSTVMAVLVNRLHIPVRNVTGFVSSEFRDGYNLVRAAHAHSWVEVYLDGEWEVFDPTPSGAQQVRVNWLLRIDDWFASYQPRHLYEWIAANWLAVLLGLSFALIVTFLAGIPYRYVRRRLAPTPVVWKRAWQGIRAICRRHDATRAYALRTDESWWEHDSPEIEPLQTFAREYVAARFGRGGKSGFRENCAIWRKARAVQKFLFHLQKRH